MPPINATKGTSIISQKYLGLDRGDEQNHLCPDRLEASLGWMCQTPEGSSDHTRQRIQLTVW